MTHAGQATFVPIGQILAEQVLPRFHLAQMFPLRVSCLGTAGYVGGDDDDSFDRIVPIGECQSPEEAMTFAAMCVSRGDIRAGTDDMLRFRPRLVVIQDSENGLVLAGAVRAGIIFWQHPVATDGEARRIVTAASRLRGMAFAASGRSDHKSAGDLRFRAGLLEARLVDPFWRQTASELLKLPQAA